MYSLIFSVAMVLNAGEETVVPSAEAHQHGGKKITVEMKVATSKNRLDKRGEIYLDSTKDFESKENLGVIITKKGAASLKKAGIEDPATHYREKTIRVTGKVEVKGTRARLMVNEADQIKLVETSGGSKSTPKSTPKSDEDK
jgi:hypothetical protein